ncbi:MAG: SusC/RagA family TonB-linked outer membrane protein [Bacteroidota bacterium]
MKRLNLVFLLLLAVVSFSYAQRTVSGTITDQEGEPLIGASILAKGTTTGTVTDFDGNYALEVPEGTTELEFSYTGFATQTLALGASNVLDVKMSEGLLLDAVVVSATGLDRNARDVTYHNQTVKSDDLLTVPSKNSLEALRGKVAGVKLSTGSGSVGASTRIVLRGEGSLTGDNNALIVVDGIVIDNEASLGGTDADEGGASTGYADYGNRFNDINPEDIESITVLKGPSATSLYGSRGASGVLLITTKKGSKGGRLRVGINSTTSFEQAYVLLQRQDRYGQGFGLPFSETPSFDSGENWSWGPEFDGVVRPWTSPIDSDGDGDLEFLSRPYSAVPNQLENFFRTGRTLANSINLSGGNEKVTYYASYSNTTQEGILENTDYNRNTVKFASSAKFSKRLSTNFSVSYANVVQNSAQEGSRPFEGQNAYANAVQSPVNIPFTELRDYNSPFHDFGGYYGSYTSNPYYILNEFINEGRIDNFLGTFSTTLNIIDGLDLTARIGTNVVDRTIREATAQYAYADHYVWADNLVASTRGGRANSPGFFSQTEGTNSNLDVTGLLNYSRALDRSGDLSLNVTLGYNNFTRTTRSVTGSTVGGIIVPEFYNLANSVQAPLASQSSSKYRIIGGFANAQIGYQNRLFLEYSARNDWSSTLPAENNSFFYQSVGVSSVVTDFFENRNENIDYVKFRASIGTTGKDAQLYALQSTFIGNPIFQPLANGRDLTFPLNGQAGFTLGNSIGNPDLKPELTTTFEIGVDATLFKDRVDLAYTYYNSRHTNQLVEVSLPNSSGFTRTVRNLGEISNQGHELSLTIRPIKGLVKGLTWDLDLIWSTNQNEVIEILDPAVDGEELTLGTFGGVAVVAREGLPYGTFRGNVVATTDAGETIVDAQGLPIQTERPEDLGSYQPDWLGSVGSRIGYKGLVLNFLFDIRQGGKFLSYTKDLTEFNGTALTTVEGGRDAFVVPNSVTEDEDGNLVENTTMTNRYDFLRVQPFSSHLIDASFVKLREIGLTYNVPARFTEGIFISNLTVGLFARNVMFWLPEENVWADPEINGPSLTGNATGIETTQTPPSRSFGINIGVKF